MNIEELRAQLRAAPEERPKEAAPRKAEGRRAAKLGLGAVGTVVEAPAAGPDVKLVAVGEDRPADPAVGDMHISSAGVEIYNGEDWDKIDGTEESTPEEEGPPFIAGLMKVTVGRDGSIEAVIEAGVMETLAADEVRPDVISSALKHLGFDPHRKIERREGRNGDVVFMQSSSPVGMF